MRKLNGLLLPATGPIQELEIDDTLEALQKVVGGYIETLAVTTDVVAIVNEEGRILGLAPNVHLPGIVGDAFLVSVDGDEFTSIQDDVIAMIRRVMR
jgi:hypothetical protein